MSPSRPEMLFRSRILCPCVISQFGVPYPDLEPGQGEGKRGGVEMPEGRVIAWLLAGREGPVGDYLRQPQAVVPVFGFTRLPFLQDSFLFLAVRTLCLHRRLPQNSPLTGRFRKRWKAR